MDTPLLGFSHIQLMVDDVAASREWYSTVLGLEQFAAADDLSYVALEHRPSHVAIVLSKRDPAGGEVDPAELLDHLAFAVRTGEILQAWADRLSAAGVTTPGSCSRTASRPSSSATRTASPSSSSPPRRGRPDRRSCPRRR